MINKRHLLLATTLLLFHPLLLFPQAGQSKAKAVLEAASKALVEVKSVTYDYVYRGYGKYNGHFSGKVEMNGQLPNMNIYVDLHSHNKAGKRIKREEITISGGQKVSLADYEDKSFKYGTLMGGSLHLSSYATYAVIFEYLHPQPFTGNMAAPTLTHEGDTTMMNMALDMVSFVNQFGDKMTYYISKEDHMIYAQRATNTNPDEDGGFFFVIKQPQFNPEINARRFSPEAPAGFESVDEDNRKLLVGSKAPGWFLPTPDGTYRRAMDYADRVVVLDFWASWCKPCWQIMPIVNEIQETYAEEAVKVFGVNAWEKPELDVAAYLKKKGYDHYETLLDKEARTAKNYKIYTLPLLVVIGKDGKIKYMHNGRSQNLKAELKAAIDAALKE